MKFNLININIKNSFNKRGTPKQNREIASDVNSTLATQEDNISQIMSNISVSSITAGFQDPGSVISYKNQSEKASLISREIFIGIISGTIGTVLGAIISYFVLGIK